MNKGDATIVESEMPAWLTLLLAVAAGMIVANLYYAQPLVGPISRDTGLPAHFAGLIVTLTQIGFGLSLLFVLPLGDLIENRRLAVIFLLITSAAAGLAARSNGAFSLLAASLLIGVGSVAAQVLVPLAAHRSPPAVRGRAVGNVMSGLLLGIMLARPAASMAAHLWGWHAIFAISSGAIAILAVVLAKALPERRPSAGMGYVALLGSMWHLLLGTKLLQRRAAYHACAFAVFSLFWTTVPLELSGPAFHFSQSGIALFALVGVSGAIAAPIAGRLADRGLTRPATALAFGLVLLSLVLPLVIGSHSPAGLAVLVLSAILMDMGVSANLVLGQRSIFSLAADIRSRLNGLYMAIFFAGGAVGSSVGAWIYAEHGWATTLATAVALPVMALLYFATERPAITPPLTVRPLTDEGRSSASCPRS